MAKRYPTGTDGDREIAVASAARALQLGDVVVIPTDTVYGVAADAFDKQAVQALLDAKGRGRAMPPPVLIGSADTLVALAINIPDWATALTEEFWPGPLTVVFHEQPSLQWDLGETRHTVAVRVPDNALTREIIDRVGPLAVSSANKTGQSAALNADDAEYMLGNDVAGIVDGGPIDPVHGGEASTIVDATSATPRLLREGAIGIGRLNEVLRPYGVELPDPNEKAVDLKKPEKPEKPDESPGS